MEPKDKEKK